MLAQVSEENVEIVRRGYEAYLRGDLGALQEDMDPDVVVYRKDPDGATFHGWDGFLKAIAEWVEDFDEFAISAREFIDANDNQVVVRVHPTAVGARSGAPIEADFWFVHTLHDARLTRLDMLVNRADALTAAGLSE
jgi:ketosteroid isomerase-like protein